MWNHENDMKLLQTIAESEERHAEPNWRKVALDFGVSVEVARKRHNHLQEPFNFSFEEEEKLVELATEYFDKEIDPDWEEISKEIRNKPAKYCEKQYYKVMQQYWDEHSTKTLLSLTDEYKLRDEKPNWVNISKELGGRPIKVCEDWYSIQIDKQKKM